MLERELASAVERRDQSALESKLIQAQNLGMNGKYSSLFSIYEHASYCLTRIKRIRENIQVFYTHRNRNEYIALKQLP